MLESAVIGKPAQLGEMSIALRQESKVLEQVGAIEIKCQLGDDTSKIASGKFLETKGSGEILSFLGGKRKGVSVPNNPKANSSKSINVGKKPLQIAIGDLRNRRTRNYFWIWLLV